MKKFVNPLPSGGAALNNEELNGVLNTEIHDTIQALLSGYNSDTEGIIVSGCVVSGAGPYDISAGIVYLNGEFMRFSAVTGQTLPKYIAPSTVTYETKTFADGGVKNLVEVKVCALAGAAPGSGQYVAITSSTDPDDRRWSKQIPSVYDSTVNTNSGGTATTILTIPRPTNKTFRVNIKMLSVYVSGGDPAGSGSSGEYTAKYKDVAGTGTIIGSMTTIDSNSSTAGAPSTITLTVSGTNLLVQATAGSGLVYAVRCIATITSV